MDIFITNIPQAVTQKQISDYFKHHLSQVGITVYDCEKLKTKTFARLSIPYSLEAQGQRFLNLHGSPRNLKGYRIPNPLTLHNRILYLSKDERPSDPWHLACLEKKFIDRQNLLQQQTKNEPRSDKANLEHTFHISTLYCGLWEYRGQRTKTLNLLPVYQDLRKGSLVLGEKSCVFILYAAPNHPKTARIDIKYSNIESIFASTFDGPNITFSLNEAPRFSEMDKQYDCNGDVVDLFAALSLGTSPGGRAFLRHRVCSLHPLHAPSAGSCLVYRVVLSDNNELQKLRTTLNLTHSAPGVLSYTTSMPFVRRDFGKEMQTLHDCLREADKSGVLTYKIRFQLQRLAQNGFLRPKVVARLLPEVQKATKQYSEAALTNAISACSRELPFPGADVDADTFSVGEVMKTILSKAKSFRYAGSSFDTAARHSHIGLIHKVAVTPSGIYLEGPTMETKNRIVRKYAGSTDHFIRVNFVEEDNGHFYTPFGVSAKRVIERFKAVMSEPILLAGRSFQFLGFSHSSLRSHQCWFMSPFVFNGNLIHAEEVILGLGDFSMIRSPAKCAARIGQAFSDSTDTIPIAQEQVKEIPDVERNGRCFTDGVGQISQRLLEKVWGEFTKTRKQRATLLQIRYKGAKGMLALNDTLLGEQIILRPSMVKFEGSPDENLEICGAGFKRLPCFLNRQLIKILEDLEVPAQSFIDLKNKAVNELYEVMTSPLTAARFIEIGRVATASSMPALIRSLRDIGIDFHADLFLRNLVEVATLTQFRDMKYRGRIPVEKAHTLYGITDETRQLREGEIYVAVRNENGERSVLLGDALITRSPAMHPGDVQLVRCVDAAPNSLLHKLHNCVVFSQHGERDLPSQLSGGDLDGDIFNIVFDRSLWPKRIYQPADYPRLPPIDIERPVVARDIIEFFGTYMETNKLGYICNTHMQIADQKRDGVLDSSCIALAAMASTEVDFPKTGIPVNMSRFPRDYSKRAKPDFMAPAPRMIIGNEITLEDVNEAVDDVDDAVAALEPDFNPPKFYESKKVLGKIYREIDETKFITQMQSAARKGAHERNTNGTALERAWAYIQRETLMIQYQHHMRTAREIRESYEAAIVSTMHQYSMHKKHPLTEVEVFAGTILGHAGGLPNKLVRELSQELKESWDRQSAMFRQWILCGDSNNIRPVAGETEMDGVVVGGVDEALERSIACIKVAMEEAGESHRRIGTIKSFAYVAAAVCLKEVERFKDLSGLTFLS